MSDPVFEVKKETHPAHLNAVRVSTRVFEAITRIGREAGVSQNEVVRQMLDFALSHMKLDSDIEYKK